MIQRHIEPKLAYRCAWVGCDDAAVIARKIEKCMYGCRWASRSVTLSWKFGIGVKRHRPGCPREGQEIAAAVIEKVASREPPSDGGDICDAHC